jgi:CRP-like cAMP-binding protein
VYQARITALMFSLVDYKKGERLFSAGDEGREMYVVIRGTLRAFLETESGVVEFDKMERGDAFGEVALFHGSRTASVVAETDAYLMRFTRSDLERLGKRHPRTTTRLYANLSELLADHVASTTQHVH